jgi:hypothetical protein
MIGFLNQWSYLKIAAVPKRLYEDVLKSLPENKLCDLRVELTPPIAIGAPRFRSFMIDFLNQRSYLKIATADASVGLL